MEFDRKLSILISVRLALNELASHNGALPPRFNSFYNLVKRYQKDVSRSEYKQVMQTSLAELFNLEDNL